jgi:hypothetical protein
MGVVNAQFYSFLASARDGNEWSASRSGCFTHKERDTGTHLKGGQVGPRAGLDVLEKQKFARAGSRDPDRFGCSRVILTTTLFGHSNNHLQVIGLLGMHFTAADRSLLQDAFRYDKCLQTKKIYDIHTEVECSRVVELVQVLLLLLLLLLLLSSSSLSIKGFIYGPRRLCQ